jgi:hypothetical protein
VAPTHRARHLDRGVIGLIVVIAIVRRVTLTFQRSRAASCMMIGFARRARVPHTAAQVHLFMQTPEAVQAQAVGCPCTCCRSRAAVIGATGFGQHAALYGVPYGSRAKAQPAPRTDIVLLISAHGLGCLCGCSRSCGHATRTTRPPDRRATGTAACCRRLAASGSPAAAAVEPLPPASPHHCPSCRLADAPAPLSVAPSSPSSSEPQP